LSAPPESTHAMAKRQLIDDIRQYNPTAQPQFLAQFSEADLEQYLGRLREVVAKRLLIGPPAPQTNLRKVS
jgi:hypothetical protein